MKNVITKSESSQPVGEAAVYLFDDWFDPIEAGMALFRANQRARNRFKARSDFGAAH